jgi:TonB-linked SusC/RagA family outer membrane protein
MKKKLLFSLLYFTLSLFATRAQVATVSGKVVSEADNYALSGATIENKSSGAKTTSKADGTFAIEATKGQTLAVSFVGYTSQNVIVSGSYVSVALALFEKTGEEVVVTAFGVKKQKKSLGFATQEIQAKDLTRERSTSFVNGLQGKVAGLVINQSGGTPGAGASIILRGIKSLDPGSNNQPLIILDGLPISNSSNAGSVLPSAGSNSIGSNEQFSTTNRGLDINPDDIESISVLKGAGATALYGLEGANGVIVITTKKGVAGKLSLNLTASYAFDDVTKYPEIQKLYREGFNGRVRFNADGSPNRFQTYGPPVTDEVFYNNQNDFFDLGFRANHSLGLSAGNDKTTFYGSISSTNHKGIIPGSKLDRYTFRINPTIKINDKITLTTASTFITSETVKPSSGDKGVISALSFYTPTFNVNDYLNADGSMKVFSPGIIDNPRYVGIYSTMREKVFRAIGNISFNYKIAPWIMLDYKLGGDYYGENRTRIVPGPRYLGDPTILDLAAGTGGFINLERINFKDVNSNLFITLTKKLSKDFDGSLMLGNSVQSTTTDYTLNRGERFSAPNIYDIAYTTNLYANAQLTRKGLVAAFADAKIGYKNALFLNITGRNDWTSTLPKNNRSYFYPGASLSYVFTELHNITNKWLSYGKLRLSASQVGKDAAPYRNGPYYNSANGFPFGNIPGIVLSREYNDPNLKPERTNSYEGGLEVKLLNNRLGFDVSIYSQTSKEQIIGVPVSAPSGFDLYTTNAGSIRNDGIELLMNGIIVKSNKIKWNATLNWSKNKSEVLQIRDDIKEIVFSSSDGRIINKLVVGGSAGDLYGRKYQRNAGGQLLITPVTNSVTGKVEGLPIAEAAFTKVGNALPDWIGSIGTDVTWKNITLSGLLEYKKGGDLYDVGLRNRIRNGTDKTTENRYQSVIFNGALANGTPNTLPVYLDEIFYRSENNYNGAAEVLLQDASWLRLRNVTLSYNLTSKLLSKTKIIKGASISASANNFILWTPYKGFDPESTSYGSGSNAFGFTGFNVPGTSNYVFSLNINL